MSGSSRCPRCGLEVRVPVKAWPLNRSLRVVLYECPRCLVKWRRVVRVE